MHSSGFQFSTPIMTRSTFALNEEFQPEEHEEVEIPTQIKTRRRISEEDASAYVEIEVEVGKESGLLPFHVVVSYSAEFKWKPDDFEGEKLESLLSKNAPALLLGYARIAISTITNFSPYPAYNLPFIDFTKEAQEKP